MSATIWQQIHGGSTHFPIVLLMASVVFDFVAWRSRDEALRRGLHAAGFGSAIVGMLGGIGAVVAGLIMTRGRVLGGGYEKLHHLFVWPSFIFCLALVGWRLFRGLRRRQMPMPQRGLGIYLAGMSVVSALMVGAGYSGGEMLLGSEAEDVPAASFSGRPSPAPEQMVQIGAGQKLFLKNCAHCHGADARGDDGPDLHNLDWTDEQIAARIRKGKKGEMTAFSGKLSPEQITEIVAYVRTLK